jgi:hypothetical protein
MAVCLCGCGNRREAVAERTEAEARIRRYLGIPASMEFTDKTVVSMLSHRFPTDTSLKEIRSALDGNGLGEDGLSSIEWQENIRRLDCIMVYAPRTTDRTHLAVYFEFNDAGGLQNIYASWEERSY